MPELPEVETVRLGLAPYLTGAVVDHVSLRRPDLRFPFPKGFEAALEGRTITRVGRRAKYLLIGLDDGRTVLSHLGMTGSYRFTERDLDQPMPAPAPDMAQKHDHMIWALDHPEHGALHLVYSDPRRFGFIDLFTDPDENAYLRGLGPEPLSNAFDAPFLAERFRRKSAPVKAGLLDQRVVAGLGNIYVCEALHRAHILPTVECRHLVRKDGDPKAVLEDLVPAIRKVLIEAIEAGGSTLRDFRAADGRSGYFQHRFAVYDREGAPCPTPQCTGTVERMVQSGRSSFYCPVCQTRVVHAT